MRCSVVERGTGALFGVPTIEAHLQVSARDVPYYLDVQMLADNVTIEVNLGFSGKTEELQDFTKGHLLVRFGQKTGRVYAIVITGWDTTQPWAGHLRRIEKDIAGKQKNRFSRNLVYGLLLGEEIVLAFRKEQANKASQPIAAKRGSG
jgi:hypothetical protein